LLGYLACLTGCSQVNQNKFHYFVDQANSVICYYYDKQLSCVLVEGEFEEEDTYEHTKTTG